MCVLVVVVATPATVATVAMLVPLAMATQASSFSRAVQSCTAVKRLIQDIQAVLWQCGIIKAMQNYVYFFCTSIAFEILILTSPMWPLDVDITLLLRPWLKFCTHPLLSLGKKKTLLLPRKNRLLPIFDLRMLYFPANVKRIPHL